MKTNINVIRRMNGLKMVLVGIVFLLLCEANVAKGNQIKGTCILLLLFVLDDFIIILFSKFSAPTIAFLPF